VSTTLRLYLQNAAVALLQRPKLFLTATGVVQRHRQAVLQQDEGPDADDVVAARQLARSFAEYLRGRALHVQADARLAPRVRTFDHLCVSECMTDSELLDNCRYYYPEGWNLVSINDC
jgi:hypothetical protein